MVWALLGVAIGTQAGPSPEELIDRLRAARGKDAGSIGQQLSDMGARAVPALGRMLQGPESDRRLAVPVLTWMRNRQAMALLGTFALDRKQRLGTRILAAYGVGNMQYPEAYPTLVRLSKDPSKYLRWSAVYGLGKIGDPRAIPLLKTPQGDRDKTLAWMSKESIKQIRSMVAKYPDRLRVDGPGRSKPAMP